MPSSGYFCNMSPIGIVYERELASLHKRPQKSDSVLENWSRN